MCAKDCQNCPGPGDIGPVSDAGGPGVLEGGGKGAAYFDYMLKTKVKAGDEITAKVYDGDYTLYNVQVVAPTGDKAAPRK